MRDDTTENIVQPRTRLAHGLTIASGRQLRHVSILVLCPARWVVILMLAPEYEVDRTDYLYTLCALESYHMMPVGCSISAPSFNWIRLTVQEL